MRDTNDFLPRPTREDLAEWLNRAGAAGQTIDLDVLRRGEATTLEDLPLTPLTGGFISRLVGNVRYGLGANLSDALLTTRLAANVRATSAMAGVESPVVSGVDPRVVAVAGTPVETWYDISRLLREAVPEEGGDVEFTLSDDGQDQTVTASFDASAAEAVRAVDWVGPVQRLDAWPCGVDRVDA